MHAHTGVVLALDWPPPSSSPARRRVELPEVNVILGNLVTSIRAGAKEGIVGGISARKEEEGEGKRRRIVSGTMNPRYYFLSQPMYLSNN